MHKIVILSLLIISCSKNNLNTDHLPVIKDTHINQNGDHIFISKDAGHDYNKLLKLASTGNSQSFYNFINTSSKLNFDTSAAEHHYFNIGLLIRYMGDYHFSKACRKLSHKLKLEVQEHILYDLGEEYDNVKILKDLYPLTYEAVTNSLNGHDNVTAELNPKSKQKESYAKQK